MFLYTNYCTFIFCIFKNDLGHTSGAAAANAPPQPNGGRDLKRGSKINNRHPYKRFGFPLTAYFCQKGTIAFEPKMCPAIFHIRHRTRYRVRFARYVQKENLSQGKYSLWHFENIYSKAVPISSNTGST